MPTGFTWVLERRLAGSGRPGMFDAMERDMAFLRGAGIKLVVTLTEAPLAPPPTDFGLKSLHFPIPDMGIPTPRAGAQLCGEVVASLARDEPVLLHCKAGVGRTGTMLACTLVTLGRTPEQALAEVRRACWRYVETEAQVRFVGHYASYLASLAP